MTQFKNYKPLRELVYEEVRERILNSEYKPNESIVASELSREFGVSVIPIREALRLLENEGLLRGTPHKSITVTPYDIEDIRQIYAVRKLLESHAAGLAAKQFSKKTLASLKEILADMGRSIKAKDYRRYQEKNTVFHRTLYEQSGNPWLCKVISDLWGKTRRSNAVVKYDPDHRNKMMQDHRNIVRALASGRDSSEIESIVAEHVEAAMHGVIAYFEYIEAREQKKRTISI